MIGSRLHVRIYLAVVASVVTVAALAGAVWRVSVGAPPVREGLASAAEVAAELLSPREAGPRGPEAVLARWHERLGVDLALFSAGHELIASAGGGLAPPDPARRESGIVHGRGGAVAFLKLPDGRWLAVRRPVRGGRIHLGFLTLLALSAVVVAFVAYPVSRRITRRLEELKERVEALGAGDLSARVPVAGHDEVARLAGSFNRAAERIEELVGAQKRLLANASHELRTPLARLKLAAGLLEGDPGVKGEIARDVAELDDLVEELLLASRLQAGAPEERFESVDLTALVAEECARADVPFQGALVSLRGSPRLLRRLVRNLLQNARRHAGGQGLETALSRGPSGGAVLEVLDRGPGVPEALRERIFEPFFRLPAAGTDEGGAGLGLSLARQVARRHGGDVVCLPREGGGSRFRVTLAG